MTLLVGAGDTNLHVPVDSEAQEPFGSAAPPAGGRSDSRAVDLVMARLPQVLPHVQTRVFPTLDHFGIERTAPRQVAQAVSDFFLKGPLPR